jgi:peptidoglycan/xylan/chitin deacetylase (PgdA/CDA1 family)
LLGEPARIRPVCQGTDGPTDGMLGQWIGSRLMRAVLTYHSIDDSGSPISLNRAVFARHLEWFDRGNVTVLSMEDLVADPSGPPAVALTFDDALHSAAVWAIPQLVERRLPATIFVPTGHVGGDNRWRGTGDAGVPMLPVMTWEALGRAQQSGMEIGAHTRSHARLPGCSAVELEDELDGAAADIQEALGVAPTSLAYPYGLADDRVCARARQRYAHCVTTELRPLGRDEDLHALPRLDTWYLQDGHMLDAWGSTVLRGYIAARRTLRRVRGIFR